MKFIFFSSIVIKIDCYYKEENQTFKSIIDSEKKIFLNVKCCVEILKIIVITTAFLEKNLIA